MMPRPLRFLPLAASLMSLLGCAVGPDYHPPAQNAPAAFAAAPAGPSAAIDPARWWRALGDAELDALVEQAVVANPDIAIGLTRLQAAQAQEAVLLGLTLPELDAAYAAAKGTGSDASRGRVPSPLTSADNSSVLPGKQIQQIGGFAGFWEIDLFGRYRRAIEAGIYDAEAAAEVRHQLLVTVIADLVRTYVDLRGLQTSLAVLRQDIAAAESSRDFVALRYQRGLTNELDLTLAERELSSLRAELAPLTARIEAARYAIASLVGRFPEELDRSLTSARPIPALPESIAPGLPLDLLQRRPDIRESERRLAAATARIGVATGNLFPRIALAGAAGAQFAAIGTDNGNHIWSLGPAAYWPLLDFGALDAQIDIADFRSQEQLLLYKRTVLNAVREVDSAVSAFAAQQDNVKNLGDALLQAQRAVTLAKERYDRGLTDFLNVVDAERRQYGLESQVIAAQQAAAEDFAALFKALGGGWEDYRATPPVRLPQPAILAMFSRLAAASQGEER